MNDEFLLLITNVYGIGEMNMIVIIKNFSLRDL